MKLNFMKARVFHSPSFCWCIPVRAGFALVTVLNLFVSGAISIIVWLEVSRKSSQAYFPATVEQSCFQIRISYPLRNVSHS